MENMVGDSELVQSNSVFYTCTVDRYFSGSNSDLKVE
jgi:hypothetical protein